MRINSFLLLGAAMLVTSSSAQAGLITMEMIAPNVGWARTAETRGAEILLWTVDGGAHWKDISPNPFPKIEKGSTPEWFHTVPESIADVSFLDTHRGWVLFCCGRENVELPRYDLAMTTDSGATWSIARVTIAAGANLQPGLDTYGGQITFADSVHGWMNVTGSAGHTVLGKLLVTSDGGRTWRGAHEEPPGGAGPSSLVTSTMGWHLTMPTYHDPDTTGLSVTRDGGRRWHSVLVPIPRKLLRVAGIPPQTYYYWLPTFENSQHGFLPVFYKAQESDAESAIVLFETVDGGRTWKPVRVISNLSNNQEEFIVDVADSTMIVAATWSQHKHATLYKDGPYGRTEIDITNYVQGREGLYYSQLSFANPKQGWMLIQGNLLSTSDGGSTWRKRDAQADVGALTNDAYPRALTGH